MKNVREVGALKHKLIAEIEKAHNRLVRIEDMDAQIPEHTDLESELEKAFFSYKEAYENYSFFLEIYPDCYPMDKKSIDKMKKVNSKNPMFRI